MPFLPVLALSSSTHCKPATPLGKTLSTACSTPTAPGESSIAVATRPLGGCGEVLRVSARAGIVTGIITIVVDAVVLVHWMGDCVLHGLHGRFAVF